MVEPDKELRRVVVSALTGNGYNVTIARNCREALTLMRSAGEPYQVLIAELRIPAAGGVQDDLVVSDMGGLDLWKRAKRIQPSLEGIIVSAYGSIDIVTKVVRAGCDYIAKPFKLADLDAALTRLAAERTAPPDTIERSIVFPSEYFQAGISMLSYFGTYLRRRYPDERAKVRIEQEGLTVRLSAETDTGQLDVIEEALDQFGLVVQGHVPVEYITEDELLAVELNCELRAAANRIEMQRDLLRLQDTRIEKLLEMVGDAIHQQGQTQPSVTVNPEITVNVPAQDAASADLALMSGELAKLSEALQQHQDLAEEVREMQARFERIEQAKEPGEVKHSAAVASLRRFFERLNDPDSDIRKRVKSVESAVKMAQSVGKRYNGIAQWCGLPTIPEPLLKAGGDSKK